MGKTSISWAHESLNTVRGCEKEDRGCRNCYALGQAWLKHNTYYKGTVKKTAGGLNWTGKVFTVPGKLDEYMTKRKKPLGVFANSMADLFHRKVDFNFIAALFGSFSLSPQHTFLTLTKRPERMIEFFNWVEQERGVFPPDYFCRERLFEIREDLWPESRWEGTIKEWPLPNVWIGISAEGQATYNQRVPLLFEVPAAIRWVSAEPLLGPVVTDQIPQKPDWIVIGGESGVGDAPRVCDLAWIRSLVQECHQRDIAAFVKQLGKFPVEDGQRIELPEKKKGAELAEWPDDLQVQEYPVDDAPQIFRPVVRETGS